MCERKSTRSKEVITCRWHLGQLQAGPAVKGGIADVRLDFRWDDRGLRAGVGTLCFDVEAVRRSYVGIEGTQTDVQIFRYVRANGDVAMFMYCHSCGHVVSAGEMEAGEIACAPCRVCGTPPSGLECQSWHTWGACLLCPGGDAPSWVDPRSAHAAAAAASPQTGTAPAASSAAVDREAAPV